MWVITARQKDRVFGSEKKKVKVFTQYWTVEEATDPLTFDTTWTFDGIWGRCTGIGTGAIPPKMATVEIDAWLVSDQEGGK